MQTRIFRSGNSLAVRIPKELAFANTGESVQIERVGSALVIRPLDKQSLADLMDVCALFSSDFMADGRDLTPEVERDLNPNSDGL